MKPKRKLKEWVRITLLMIPEVIIISELFFVAINLNEIKNQNKNIECNCISFYEQSEERACVEY